MRRNWIKIYPEGFLRRTLFKELLPVERWVWIGFLCLAGDNAFDGKICVAEDMGYTDEQLAKLLDTDLKILKVSKNKMVEFEKISVDENNVIRILNWDIYQSEYQRQRDYREEYKKKLQRKVTTQSNNAKLRIDRDRDRDKDRDKDRNTCVIKDKSINKNQKSKREYTDSFEEFWNLYPRKYNKSRAFACWKARLKQGEIPDNIIKATILYMKWCEFKNQEEQYIMHPSTFIGIHQPYLDWSDEEKIKNMTVPEYLRGIKKFYDRGDNEQG